jgi:leader peptidase (prepilin peptidase)/N-methyltransferase
MDLWVMGCVGLLAVGLAALAIIDLRTGYLPDALQIALGVGGMAVAIVGSPIGVTWPLALGGAALNAIVFFGLRYVISRVKGREAMGLGDVKLVAVGGLWVGPFALPYIMAAGGVLTLVGAGVASVATRRPVWRGEMPLGPGLAAGILAMFVAAIMHASPVSLTWPLNSR